MKIILVIPVQYINFLNIFGFSGDPGSSPAILRVLCLLTSIGSMTKNTIHQIIIKIIAKPVELN